MNENLGRAPNSRIASPFGMRLEFCNVVNHKKIQDFFKPMRHLKPSLSLLSYPPKNWKTSQLRIRKYNIIRKSFWMGTTLLV